MLILWMLQQWIFILVTNCFTKIMCGKVHCRDAQKPIFQAKDLVSLNKSTVCKYRSEFNTSPGKVNTIMQ
jgi:hypothetical protein